LVQNIPHHDVTVNKDFIHILNIISNTNKFTWLPELQKAITTVWKEEYIEIYGNVLLHQCLYTEIYIQIYEFFTSGQKEQILKNIFKRNLTSNQSILLGKFFGILFLNSNFSCDRVTDFYNDKIDEYPGLIISASIELSKCKESKYKDLINTSYKNLDERTNLDTKILMLLYDLESIVDI